MGPNIHKLVWQYAVRPPAKSLIVLFGSNVNRHLEPTSLDSLVQKEHCRMPQSMFGLACFEIHLDHLKLFQMQYGRSCEHFPLAAAWGT